MTSEMQASVDKAVNESSDKGSVGFSERYRTDKSFRSGMVSGLMVGILVGAVATFFFTNKHSK